MKVNQQRAASDFSAAGFAVSLNAPNYFIKVM